MLIFNLEQFRHLITLFTLFQYQTGQKGCDGSVREFDYDQGPLTSLLIALGFKESNNVKQYGSAVPPLLDPKNIQVPVKLYYSDGDDFVPEEVCHANIHRPPLVLSEMEKT